GRALGLEPGYMAERLRTTAAAFGRQERFTREGRRFTMMLAKNPTGFIEILRESERADGRHFLIGLNDRIADGRDVSWIWDVDFELLAGRAEVIVPTGVRAFDLAVRLKYADLSAAQAPEPDLGLAVRRLIDATPAGGEGFLLCTYTAMLDLRALLVRRLRVPRAEAAGPALPRRGRSRPHLRLQVGLHPASTACCDRPQVGHLPPHP